MSESCWRCSARLVLVTQEQDRVKRTFLSLVSHGLASWHFQFPARRTSSFSKGGRGRDSSEEGQGGGEGAFKRREGRVSDLRTEGKRGETRQANRRKLVPSTHQPATAPSVSPVFCLCFNIEAAVFLRDGINAHLMSHGRVGQILRSVWSRV